MNELPKKQIMVSFNHSYFFCFFVSYFFFWLFFFLNPRPLCHLLILSVSRSFNGNSKTTKENAMQIFSKCAAIFKCNSTISSSTNLKKIVYWTLCKNNLIHILFIIPSSTNEKKERRRTWDRSVWLWRHPLRSWSRDLCRGTDGPPGRWSASRLR